MPIDKGLLRGAIYRVYDSQNAFTADLGWSKNKINNILKGSRTPDINDCRDISEKLKLSRDEFWEIFLPELSPFRDKTVS